ncbi:hypothetical protein OIO90_003305 [Microbotryomycetes sp. JL221]|nr:hypothetical protein OIO90_003305 [Microbotryomycetes sp. JL221]
MYQNDHLEQSSKTDESSISSAPLETDSTWLAQQAQAGSTSSPNVIKTLNGVDNLELDERTSSLRDKVDAVWGTRASETTTIDSSLSPSRSIKGKARATFDTQDDREQDLGQEFIHSQYSNGQRNDQLYDDVVKSDRAYTTFGLDEPNQDETSRIGRGHRVAAARDDQFGASNYNDLYDMSPGGDATESFPPEQGDEDEKEAKRVADHLAQWSRAEAQKRKTARKSQVIVMPSTHANSATTAATTLARRSSALIRHGSKRISRDISALAQNGQDETALIGGHASKRAQRGQSTLLRGNSIDSETHQSIEGSIHGPPLVLERIKETSNGVEGDDEQDSLVTPTESIVTNPFASRPSSAIRTLSYDTTRSTPTSSRHNSRFIEDLESSAPPLGHRSPFEYDNMDNKNPFDDTSGALELQRQTSPMSQSARGRGNTLSSVQSDSTVKGVDSNSIIDNPSQTVTYSHTRMSVNTRPTDGVDDDDGQSDELDDVWDKNEVSWLDCMLCNCFRARGGVQEDDDQQAGRTNPNE